MMTKVLDRKQFLQLATVFEGGLVILAYGLGWLVDIDPLETLHFSSNAVAMGLLGTIPLLLFFAFSYRLQVPQLENIKRMLIETLGPYLSACRWYELIYVAFLAGFCEEVLFRGVLQPWMETLWGWWPALLVSNILFGLAHSVTVLYTVLAMLTGMYLGWMLDAAGERNLLVPMLVHGLYDFVAFYMVVVMYRSGQNSAGDGDSR